MLSFTNSNLCEIRLTLSHWRLHLLRLKIPGICSNSFIGSVMSQGGISPDESSRLFSQGRRQGNNWHSEQHFTGNHRAYHSWKKTLISSFLIVFFTLKPNMFASMWYLCHHTSLWILMYTVCRLLITHLWLYHENELTLRATWVQADKIATWLLTIET